MTIRIGRYAAILFSLAGLIPNQAHASTLQGIGRTVQAFYYNGVFASPEGEINAATGTSNPASLLTVPVNYNEGSADLSTIVIGGTQITITNLANGAPFCVSNNAGSNCPDVIDGFDFKFTGENILSVSVNNGSNSGFLPVSGTFQGNTHFGLQLISPNEIRIDVTGDAPANNAQLILDVNNAPEPSSTMIFALLGLSAALYQVRRRRLFAR